jgi:hypothetical protein
VEDHLHARHVDGRADACQLRLELENKIIMLLVVGEAELVDKDDGLSLATAWQGHNH